MSETKKKTPAKAPTQPAAETAEQPVEAAAEERTEGESGGEIPPRVEALMRLYPQYEEIWVTPKGFVHPASAPAYMRKGATLYKNKHFNK